MKRLILAVLAGVMFPACGLAVSDAQNKLLARRAAEADCYRKLTERIMGLQIRGQTTVRDFVTESDQIQTEVNSFIRGIRLGEPRYYSDGSCEVRGEVTYEKVVACMREVHSRHSKNSHFTGADFNEMATRKERSVISAVGMGAPRPNRPIDQPDGTVTQPAEEEAAPLSLPDLWLKIGPRGRLMAMQAARTDAYRRLAEQLRGFKITSNTSVRDFVTESDEIRTELNATLRGAREVHVYFHENEPICEVTMEIPWQKVIATIRDSYTTHIHNNHIKESVFNELESRVEKKYFRATGMGIPPERYMGSIQSEMLVAPPEWMNQTLRATGQAAIENKGNEAQAKLMAQRAAELDAKRKLAEQIAGLTISGQTTVKDFMAQHDQVRMELNGIIDGAYVKDKPQIEGGIVRVTVELPGARVWKAVADEMNVNRERN